MVNVCITIDTEGDSANNPHSTYLGISIILPKLVQLFDKYKIKATFFIQEDEICQVGSIFDKFWKSLKSQDHEIGYHTHGLIKAKIEKKEEIITKGIQNLKRLGLHPVSFRAGRYHFNNTIIKILEKNNIKYDSSVVPGLKEYFKDGTPRCDHIGAPHTPYFPSYKNHCVEGDSSILELPINRYPKFLSNRWGGTLTGSKENEEVLFDYFYEIRKDNVIIISFHSWNGLHWAIKRFVRKEKYGIIRRFIFELMAKIIGQKFFIDSNYFLHLEYLLKYLADKNDVFFTTIQLAGERIISCVNQH